MTKILLVAGARPNFMKIAPILRELAKHPQEFDSIFVHTGQHYDFEMSGSFFSSLGIREPDYDLGVGSGSHAVQTANVMIRFEDVCIKERPDLVLVVGDVNSTIAASLVAKKLHIRLAHVEAGLRSRDKTMPEEINRIATDAISDLLFTTEKEANANLLKEGHARQNIHFVGHVMIDNLLYQLRKIGEQPPPRLPQSLRESLPNKYLCMTMHRPSNVDDREILVSILRAVKTLSEKGPVIFPCHPRTKARIKDFGLEYLFNILPKEKRTLYSGFFLVDPLDYDDFLYLWKDAALVLTDSGGLQEETTALKIPCITVRKNTERPITVEVGSNIVVNTDGERITELGLRALAGQWKKSSIPVLWDGKASKRIVRVIIDTI